MDVGTALDRLMSDALTAGLDQINIQQAGTDWRFTATRSDRPVLIVSPNVDALCRDVRATLRAR